MSDAMSAEDDIEELAGEYVLGTLAPEERATVAARRHREARLDEAIRAWEARLSPLDGATRPVAPPPALWERIEQRLDVGDTVSQLVVARREARTWRRLALSAMATAAALIIVVALQTFVWRPAPATYVAVFAKDDVQPAFYMTFDLERRELTIRPIDATRQPGKTYQLWIASEQFGSSPRSLGLMDEALAPTTKVLGDYDRSLLQRATFGVSLEPAGGSPTGRPTSPALHAKLLPVSQ